jgi:hypothetical protein
MRENARRHQGGRTAAVVTAIVAADDPREATGFFSMRRAVKGTIEPTRGLSWVAFKRLNTIESERSQRVNG